MKSAVEFIQSCFNHHEDRKTFVFQRETLKHVLAIVVDSEPVRYTWWLLKRLPDYMYKMEKNRSIYSM